MKIMSDLIVALYKIRDAILGKSGSGEQQKKTEYFKIVHAPTHVCSFVGYIDDEIIDGDLIPIEEFYNEYLINGEHLTTMNTIFFVYDEIPCGADFATVDIYNGNVNYMSATAENTREAWFYRELRDYPGKYICGIAG